MNPLNDKGSKYQLYSSYLEILVSYSETKSIQRLYDLLGSHFAIILDHWISLFLSRYTMKCQSAIFLSRCICLLWLSLLPLWLQGLNAYGNALQDTCLWLRPLHDCHFSLVYVAQLSGSVLWVAPGTGTGRQKSEWQLSSKQTHHHRLMCFRGQVPVAGISTISMGLKVHIYLKL